MTDCRMRPEFLTVEDVLVIQRDQLGRYGGDPGLLSLPALESAVAQPAATFDANYLHEDLFLMAAAYLFHISQGHAFVNGNKRTGYAAAVVFLRINGIAVPFSDTLYDLTMAVAQGQKDKESVADELRRLAGNELPEPSARAHRRSVVSKSSRNSGKQWTPAEVKQLKREAAQNTPTRVVGLHLGRTPAAVYKRASEEGVSLKPPNQSPYGRSKK